MEKKRSAEEGIRRTNRRLLMIFVPITVIFTVGLIAGVGFLFARGYITVDKGRVCINGNCITERGDGRMGDGDWFVMEVDGDNGRVRIEGGKRRRGSSEESGESSGSSKMKLDTEGA